MRGDRGTIPRVPASSFTEKDGHHQRRHAGIDMHHGSSREINGTHLAYPASSPYPMSQRVVNHKRPQHGKQKETAEFNPFGKRADNQSGGDHGKHSLKRHEQKFGNS